MGESQARRFLERNRSAVVNGVREVKRLVDFLIEKKYLLGEMPNEINSKNTKQDQMRELYTHLNADRGYELVLTWLKGNEPDLIEDLEKNSDTDHGEPARKRPRGSEEAVDQPDSHSSRRDLQSFSTLPKLEKWVSDSKISEDLIGTLNAKLAEGEMESLEKQLKDKKLKKGLCFSTSDVKDINSNQKLQSFFDSCKDAKFPDLPIKLFFEKDRGQATGESKTEKDDEHRLDEDVFSDVVTDSALGSSCSSSYGSNQSLFRKHSSQTEDLSASYGGSELTDSSYNVRTTSEDQIQNINVLLTVAPPTALGVAGDSPRQGKAPLQNPDPDPHATFKERDMPTQIESKGVTFSKQRQELPDARCQRNTTQRCPLSTQRTDKDGTPLEEAMDMSYEPNKQFTRELLTSKPPRFPSPSLGVAADGPLLEKPLDLLESEGKMQCDPAVANSEPLFEYDHEDVDDSITQDKVPHMNFQESEADRHCDPEVANKEGLDEYGCEGVVGGIMQGGVPQMRSDSDSFKEFEGTQSASQKDGGRSDIPKRRRELPEAQCGSQTQRKAPLQEAMDMHQASCEPNIQPAGDLLTGKSSTGQQLSTTLDVAVDDSGHIQDPIATQGESRSQLISADMPCQKSNASKQVDQKPDANEQSKTIRINYEPHVDRDSIHIGTEDMNEADRFIQQQGQDENGTGLTCTSVAVPSFSGERQDNSGDAPLTSMEPAGKAKRRQNSRKPSAINDQRRLLYEWAKRRCSSGSEEELEKVLDCISIENQVEHREYPCFAAENVMVYADPQTGDKQIIVIDEKNSAARKTLLNKTRVLLNYQMWVCGVQKAVLVNQDDREVQLDETFMKGIRNKCERFVFEALAPALAVFKKMQRQERLYSLISNH